MDTSTFIERLNEDLGTEYQSIVQYIQHIATIKGPEYHSITEELANHLGQELQHAKILAQQIDFLGGTPTVNVPDIPDAPDGAAALKTRRLKARASTQTSGLCGWRPEPPGKRVGQAGVGAVPHPGDIAVGPDQHGGRIGNRAKYRKIPIANNFRVE